MISLGYLNLRLCQWPYLDISLVDRLIPLHNKTINPVTAIAARTRGLVTNEMSALHGGNLALVAFQFIPPFGRSMLNRMRACEMREGD